MANQDAIKMQSRCNQMQSGARFEMANQDAIKIQSGARFERYSEVLSGTQWYSVVLSGTQWYSEVLRGTQRSLHAMRVRRRRGREGEGRMRLPQNS